MGATFDGRIGRNINVRANRHDRPTGRCGIAGPGRDQLCGNRGLRCAGL